MIRMREEMRKVKNQRVKPNSRDYNTTDFDDMKVQRKRRRDCTNRMESGILRSDMVTNRMVQDKGNKIQVVGSDVEALYPSLEAVEVAEIVYEAVLKTKIKLRTLTGWKAANTLLLHLQSKSVGWAHSRGSFPGGDA